MVRRRLFVCVLATGTLAAQTAPPPATPPRAPSIAVGSKGLVVSGRAAASEAGTKMLAAGGNAADAGAATLLALSVLTVGAFCIGGEVPILYYGADRNTV